MLVRNVVGVVQCIQGYVGHIDSHEPSLYVFDAGPMFAVMVLLLVLYAPKLFKQRKGDGLQERERWTCRPMRLTHAWTDDGAADRYD